ncbi:MAG: DUF421 domain-containing protein [Clostridia bacterium]|nr:DUF421 domain-containing protein [Clostridia bacterium]
MATVFVRTIIIYFLFITTIRLMGKRQVGELQLSELIITFMLSELAVNPIQDISIPLTYSVVPLLLLLTIEVILSFWVTKSKVAKKLFFGNPSIIIKDGLLDQKELSRLRIGINELLGELRLKGFADISDIEYAIIEQNGKLSVFPKIEKQPATLGDLDIKKEECGVSLPIILDGSVDLSNLKNLNKTEKWLKSYLSKHKLQMEDIFLLSCDKSGKISIIMKESE